MTITTEALTGDAILAAIDDLARLRMAVFADWPYLYDGDAAYEADYIRQFVADPDSVLIAAREGGRIVGAATASPMRGQDADVAAPFAERGHDLDTLFYFGESVLLPEFRGRGIGHAFFDLREAQARRCGAAITTFCAVQRPTDHPDRPAGYVPLDAFWRKRGYAPVDGLVTRFTWKDHRDAGETAKPMQFWLRDL